MPYLKILETFIFTVLMDKTEYNFFHKNFRPIRLFTILILVCNVVFTVYLLSKIDRIHKVIVTKCPAVLEHIAKPVDPLVDSEKKK